MLSKTIHIILSYFVGYVGGFTLFMLICMMVGSAL
jgi:hypothetical protein